MSNIPQEAEAVLLERFGKDSIISIATALICTGCGRRCLLTNPGCGKGRTQQENAVQEYNQTYQTNETYQSGEAFPSERPHKPRK